MGSVRARSDTGALFLDFIFRGQRIREQTDLLDTPSNRQRLQRKLQVIERQIITGRFDFEKTFGHPSPKQSGEAPPFSTAGPKSTQAPSKASAGIPTFDDFANRWYFEMEPEWRRSYRVTQRGALDKYLIPHFHKTPIDQVTKADVLALRSSLTALSGRASSTLSPRRINAIMKPLRQILNEAADRFNFPTPFRNIKPLRVKRTEVQPFTLEEVKRLIDAVRPDFKAYLVLRFFTGMRTGESNGLKWKYVDFERRQILVRESVVLGEEDDLKTDSSHRDILMVDVVWDALRDHRLNATGSSEYVFCNRLGGPIDNKNFVNRIWNPLLSRVGIPRRRPYHMRHTAATLWLASGESPEWIAKQLGHTTTEMLFRVYSRYVPNLTRSDGSAVNRLLTGLLEPRSKPDQMF